jgi:hypothetical protein
MPRYECIRRQTPHPLPILTTPSQAPLFRSPTTLLTPATMTSLHALTIPPLVRGMHNISAIMKKAQASGIDTATILAARIHPTMLPFSYQIKFLCDIAARIPHDINPSLAPSPLPPFEESPTFDNLFSRITAAINYMESFAPEDFDGREDAVVKLRIDRRGWAGDIGYVEYSALEFVQMHAHPYFWFHVTTAYNLLRAGNVDIGKIDFLNGAGLKAWEFKDE